MLTEDAFQRRFGRPAQHVVRAPGRVNLIGEHVDYNDGFVMPVALPHSTRVAIAGRSDNELHLASSKIEETHRCHISSLIPGPQKHWFRYAEGVVWALQQNGYPTKGADVWIESDVPVGAGLSSSAALEVAVALAFGQLNSYEIPKITLAKLCQQAEHLFTGTLCGIMDQFISVHAQADTALLLDCRTLDFTTVTIPADAVLLVVDSMEKHALNSGEYNVRRQQCQDAKAILKTASLRDVSMDQLQQSKHLFHVDELSFRRARHVVTEIERTRQAANFLRDQNLCEIGQLLNESHQSLRTDYEVSTDRLDLLVNLTTNCEGVWGARMTGGGFGGSIVALVKRENADTVAQHVQAAYRERTGVDASVIPFRPGAGAEVLK
jgi:galactokinase